MNIVRTATAVILVGFISACAMQTESGGGASSEVNVSNDLTNRYGEVQIAVNPKNPNNLVYADVQLGYTYACQAAKNPDCDIVQMKIGGGAFGGGGGGNQRGAGGQGGAGAQGAAGAQARPGGQGGAGAQGAAGAQARPGGQGGAGAQGAAGNPAARFAGGFPQPKGLFYGHNFDVVGVFTSFDRGKTWKRVSVPVPSPKYPDLTGWGDPSVVATPDGTFYLSYDDMDWGTPDKPLVKSMVGVSKSTDGGLTWTSPVPTGTSTDGPKMTVDLSTSTIYEGSGGNRQLVSSKDGMNWTKPQSFGGTDGTKTFSPGIGGNAMSAAHGTLAFAFRATDAAGCAYFVGGPAPCVIFETTTDSGVTWIRHRVPASVQGTPDMAADPSKKDHYTVAVLNEGDKAFQVFQTMDAGKTWTGSAIVTDDATKQHYHPWMSYSPTGVLGLAWRTRQPVPGQAAPPPAEPGPGGGPALPYNVWATISRDGGASFSAPLMVSAADSPAPEAGMFGNNGDDYSAITVDGNYAYIGWADWRPGDRQGFFRAIKLNEFKPAH